MDFSIIIPAYNEETKIANDLQAAAIFLQQEKLRGEIILVDDGSEDNTSVISKEIASRLANIKVLQFKKHTGKGFAVKKGIQASQGEYVMFADSGNCIPYTDALVGKKMIETGICDIANGSRKLEKSYISRSHSFLRKIISKSIRKILIVWIGLPNSFTDTQCGFKIYRGDIARELYGDCIKNGFLFDVEIIMRGLKKGYKIQEFPVHWTADLDSRLSPFKNFVGIIRELFELKRILKSI